MNRESLTELLYVWVCDLIFLRLWNELLIFSNARLMLHVCWKFTIAALHSLLVAGFSLFQLMFVALSLSNKVLCCCWYEIFSNFFFYLFYFHFSCRIFFSVILKCRQKSLDANKVNKNVPLLILELWITTKKTWKKWTTTLFCIK